jgi:hypothetical protein
MTQEQAARDTIAAKQSLLRETFPGLEQEANISYDDIADLVAVDRELKDNFMAPPDVREAAWDILDAMGDEEDNAMLKKGGFAGGGGLLTIGIVLLGLGMRKKPAAA